MILSNRRSHGLPSYDQAIAKGFSHEEAMNIASMEGEPDIIWQAFNDAEPETKETLDSLKVDIFGRPLPKPFGVRFSGESNEK